MTPGSTHREVELKVRVSDDFVLPDLVGIGSVAAVRPHDTVDLRAVYHDTENLTLLRWGITMRRREGGSDEGWHLKLPVSGASAGTRDEVHADLAEGAVGFVPAAFIDVVSPLLREQQVRPLAEVHTRRTAYELIDADGVTRAELVDDRVTISRQGRPVDSFHEIEVEALDATDPAALDMLSVVAEHLVDAGGSRSTVSKAAGALGPSAKLPPDVPDLEFPDGRGMVVDAVRAILARHVRHFLMADVSVRRALPDSVHQMRVAARRLRSTLATFAPVLDSERTQTLREELKWMASELGAIRDTEVLQERLDEHARALPEPYAEYAATAIDQVLTRRMAAARSSAIAALRSDRHQYLIDDLIAAVETPPVSDLAYVSCSKALPPLVRKAWKRLAHDVRELDLNVPSAQWHLARIRAKQARYATEAVSGILGAGFPRLAEALADVTDTLGAHQDAHVAQTTLTSLVDSVDGPTGFALGLLHEYEAEEEILDRLRFLELWPGVRKAARKAGLPA